MKLFVDKIEALRVNSVRLSDGSFEDSVFTPPPASIARRQCPHVQPPKAVKTPDPAYPKADSENGFMGTVFVSLTVLPDGSVDNVQLTGAATHGMNDVSQQILRTWKFKPAMGGGEPMAFDITVEVYFGLSR
jgi:TonB family protein